MLSCIHLSAGIRHKSVLQEGPQKLPMCLSLLFSALRVPFYYGGNLSFRPETRCPANERSCGVKAQVHCDQRFDQTARLPFGGMQAKDGTLNAVLCWRMAGHPPVLVH
jgi:hypothetical protein